MGIVRSFNCPWVGICPRMGVVGSLNYPWVGICPRMGVVDSMNCPLLGIVQWGNCPINIQTEHLSRRIKRKKNAVFIFVN